MIDSILKHSSNLQNHHFCRVATKKQKNKKKHTMKSIKRVAKIKE